MNDTRSFGHHFETILRYWERCHDPIAGGFHHRIDSTGTVIPSSQRIILGQARLLYNYAEGVRAGLGFCRTHADHLYDHITTRHRTRADGSVHSLDGALYAPTALDTYMNLFVCDRHGPLCPSHRADPRRGPEPGACSGQIEDDDPIPARSRTDGTWAAGAQDDRLFAPMGRFAGNIVLLIIGSVQSALRDAGPHGRANWAAGCSRSASCSLTRILDPRETSSPSTLRKTAFNPPAELPEPTPRSPTAWNWFGFFREWPGCRAAAETERAILEKALNHAVRRTDNFTRSILSDRRTVCGPASFWTQAEAVKDFGLARAYFNGPYREAFSPHADFYFHNSSSLQMAESSAPWTATAVVTSRMKGLRLVSRYYLSSTDCA